MKINSKSALLTVGVIIFGMSTANAHVEFNPDAVAANKTQVLTINVPHDCTKSSKTLEIKLQIPANVDIATFKSIGVYQHGALVKKWTESITKSGAKSYLDIKGPAMQAGPDNGPNAANIKFQFKTPAAAGTQLKWPALQICSTGISVRWIQPRPADGSDPAADATPVPVLNLKK